MSWHMIRIFWLSLIALVLPAQALASLERDQSVPGKAAAALMALLHQNEQPDSPQSQTHFTGSKAALLNSLRGTFSERYNRQNTDTDSLDNITPFYPLADNRLTLQFARPLKPAPYQDFHSSYRLSGWKETNAMYVALNSQYFL